MSQTLRHAYGVVGMRTAASALVRRPSWRNLLLVLQTLEMATDFWLIMWLFVAGGPMISRMSWIEQATMIVGAVVSVFVAYTSYERRLPGTEGPFSSLQETPSWALLFLITLPVSSFIYACTNVVAQILMAVKGPVTVTHKASGSE